MFKPLKFDLQYFADGGDATDGVDQGTEQNTDTNAQPNEEAKTLSQAELDKLVSQNKSKGKTEGQKELLKTLGYDSADDLQAVLNSVKEAENAKKTELERANEQLETSTKTISELESEVKTLRANNVALGMGVKSDSVEDVVALAGRNVNEETGIEDAIKVVIEKYPNFLENAEAEGQGNKRTIVPGGNPSSKKDNGDAFTDAFNKFK